MPSLEIALELLLVALVVALVTRRSGRPYTIALVIWGLVLGMFGALGPLGLSKELVLSVFLPPLLLEDALQIRVDLLRRRAGLVLLLAFAGATLSALAVGAAARFLLEAPAGADRGGPSPSEWPVVGAAALAPSLLVEAWRWMGRHRVRP